MLVKFDKEDTRNRKQVQNWWKDIFTNNASRVYMANVNCSSSEGQPLCEKLHLNRFPAFLAFTDATHYHQAGASQIKNKDALEEWATNSWHDSSKKTLESRDRQKDRRSSKEKDRDSDRKEKERDRKDREREKDNDQKDKEIMNRENERNK